MVFSNSVRRVCVSFLAVVVSWSSLSSTRGARADESVRTTTSLSLAPESVSFYTALLRNREQWDVFLKSNAYAKLREMPLVQLGFTLAKVQWDNPEEPQLKAFKDFVTAPENVPLVEFLTDLVSNEMFVFGDQSFADQMAFYNDLSRAMRQFQTESVRNGQLDPAASADKIIEILAANQEKLAVPDLTAGFRVKDVERAKAQLARLEQLAMLLSQGHPLFGGRISKQKIGAGEYLVVSLDGTMIPWDQVKDPELANNPRWGQLVEKLKKKTAVVALGMHEEYVIVSVGDSSAHLAQLGQGKLLVDRPEMAPLLKGPARQLVNIAYVNKDFLSKVSNPADQIDGAISSIETALPLMPGPDATKQELVKDLKTFAASIRKMIPEPTSVTGFRYQTPRGYETMTYSWGGAKQVPASGPLSVLSHIGANPIMFSAGHLSPQVSDLDSLAWLLERALYYAEQFHVANLPADEQAQFRQFREAFEPLVKRIGATTRETLIPALAGGQLAVVLDAETLHKQWHQALPEAENALPLPSVALVLQVNDTAPLKTAGAEYLATAQALVAKLTELFQGQVPPIPLAAPQSREFPNGTIHYYSLPEEVGLARFIAPNAGLNKTLAVFSLLPQQSRRLLDPTAPPQEGPLAKAQQKAVTASRLNFPALVDVIAIWTRYLVNEAGAADEAAAGVMPQVETLFTVLKCWKGVATVTYVEGDDLISHTESHYEDLP